VHGLEAIPAPSTATAKALLAPPPGKVFEDVLPDAAPRGGRELSRQEQLLSDRRLTLKAKLDLQARLAAANLGSLLFVHGPQAASQGAPSARPATARSGAATARQPSPPRPGPAVATPIRPRPLTARLATPRTALDVGRRRPATARPAAQRPAAEASARRHAPTPTLRVWAVQSSPAEHAEPKQEGPEQDLPASVRGPADGDEQAPALMILKCNQHFKSQPDPRWKDRFRETALELQKVADLERTYAERMSNYSGKQISRARVQLNTPRDAPVRQARS
jgi:hypothetical protein